jgi:hypothetical protein
MWVEALKNCPSIGKAGAVKNLDERSARVLILLGYATATVKPEPPKPAKVKRTYRRKDMVPEEPVEVVFQPEPEPEPEPEPVEDDPVDDDTDGDDETAVRL